MSYLDVHKDEILELWESPDMEQNITKVASYIYHKHSYLSDDRSEDTVRRSLSKALHRWLADKDLVSQNVKYKKQHQKSLDQNRIERKSFREYARIENSVSEYGKALTEQNKKFAEELSKINLNRISRKGQGVGVMQITDVHGNELINLPHNKYDFEVLSKRLKKYVNESLDYFKFKGVKRVLIAFTGDLLNSDRRLDELLNQATNRSKATVLMIHLFKQAILEVRNEGYKVDIISVLGNESRVNKEMTFSKEAFSDNYDFTIVAQLKQMFEFAEIKGVRFHSIDDLETTVKIEDQVWLMKHNLDKTLDQQKNTQSSIGAHTLKGNPVDFIIGGHIHAHRGTDIGVRSGSMSGSNSYNENALGLMGRASGVCYFVQGKERYYQYIDLQHADNDGYSIVKELESYNAKSHSKTHEQKTILQITI